MIRTARLVLRTWREEDRAPFAAINADPRVMEHFPAPLTREQSDAFVDRVEAGFAESGFGLWAVERDGDLLGLTGLATVPADLPCAPGVEVGWRLAVSAWGHGYAWEAAAAAIDDGRARGVGEVVSFTAGTNSRSERVMQRLGMRRDGVFDHPRLPEGSRLRPHVLYRLPAGQPPLRPG